LFLFNPGLLTYLREHAHITSNPEI
jgi:hypothetical protein